MISILGTRLVPDEAFFQRWLLEKDRDGEARDVVYLLYGANTPEKKANADREFDEMRNVIKAEAHQRSRSLSDLWATPAMSKRTAVAVGVQVMGQFTGINGEKVRSPLCPILIMRRL